MLTPEQQQLLIEAEDATNHHHERWVNFIKKYPQNIELHDVFLKRDKYLQYFYNHYNHLKYLNERIDELDAIIKRSVN